MKVLLNKIESNYLEKIVLYGMMTLLAALTFSSALVEISFMVALIAWLLWKVKEKAVISSLKRVPAIKILLCYVGVVILSLAWSENYALSFKGVLKVLQQFCILILAFDTFRSKENLKKLAICFIGLSVVVVLNTTYQYFVGRDLIRGFTGELAAAGLRVSGSFKSYGLLASYLITTLPLLVGLFFYFQKKAEKSPYLIGLIGFLTIASGVLVFLTRSRGAILALIFGALLYLVLNRKFLVLLGLGVCLVGSLFVLPKSMVIHLDAEGKEQSLVERYYLWDRALHVIKAKPITGTGINTYAETHMAYDQTKSWRVLRYYAHNGYLQLAAETGIPSLILYLCFLGGLWRFGFKSAQGLEKVAGQSVLMGALIGIANFSALAFVDTVMHNPLPIMTFWFLLGTSLAFGEALKPTKENLILTV